MKPSTSMRAAGNAVSSAITSPLPSAVPRCGSRRSSACRMSSRLVVGDCTTAAAAAMPTTPMRTLSGCSLTKDLAASRAATMRVGAMSVAFMLPDMSSARITVSTRDGSVTVACGRATASSMAVSPTSQSSGGTMRRQRPSAPLPTDSRLANCAAMRRRRRTTAAYSAIASGMASNTQSRRGQRNVRAVDSNIGFAGFSARAARR